jgi:hypothetical protein
MEPRREDPDMTLLALFGVGVLLGMRFRVLVLIPAIACAVLIQVALAVVSGQHSFGNPPRCRDRSDPADRLLGRTCWTIHVGLCPAEPHPRRIGLWFTASFSQGELSSRPARFTAPAERPVLCRIEGDGPGNIGIG